MTIAKQTLAEIVQSQQSLLLNCRIVLAENYFSYYQIHLIPFIKGFQKPKETVIIIPSVFLKTALELSDKIQKKRKT